MKEGDRAGVGGICPVYDFCFERIYLQDSGNVRLVLFSGEVMPVKQLNIWRKYLPEAKYVNLYGPTEITCNCMYYEVDREFSPGETLPLGKPFPNERVFLLDEEDHLVTEPGKEGRSAWQERPWLLGTVTIRKQKSGHLCRIP